MDSRGKAIRQFWDQAGAALVPIRGRSHKNATLALELIQVVKQFLLGGPFASESVQIIQQKQLVGTNPPAPLACGIGAQVGQELLEKFLGRKKQGFARLVGLPAGQGDSFQQMGFPHTVGACEQNRAGRNLPFSNGIGRGQGLPIGYSGKKAGQTP